MPVESPSDKEADHKRLRQTCQHPYGMRGLGDRLWAIATSLITPIGPVEDGMRLLRLAGTHPA